MTPAADAFFDGAATLKSRLQIFVGATGNWNSLEFLVQIVFWLQTPNVSTGIYLDQILTGITTCYIDG